MKLIRNLQTYINNNGTFTHVGDVAYYPIDQMKLFQLWDKLNIPHAKKKQIYGPVIPYVGFNVDPNTMTISLSDDCQTKLIAKVLDFSKVGKCHSLLEFQCLAGHINQSLPMWPLLRPSLSAMYAKIAGETKPLADVHVNKAIEMELTWFVSHVSQYSGALLLRSVAWDLNIAADDFTIWYTNTCLTGMVYYYLELMLGYQYRIPKEDQGEIIFFYEAATITVCIVHKLDHLQPRPAVHSDSHNTIDIWNSLKASKIYNDLLRTAIDSMIHNFLDVHVLHVPGSKNLVADALLQGNNSFA